MPKPLFLYVDAGFIFSSSDINVEKRVGLENLLERKEPKKPKRKRVL